MNTFYNFETKTVINPLEKITHFYVSPYMPDNFRMLGLDKKVENMSDLSVGVTPQKHIVTVFKIEQLISGDCSIKWTSDDVFCINNRIWCKIIDPTCVRVDTVRW